MKTNESLLHKGMRTIVQSALRREANEPCHVCWVYQPHRPEKPLPQPQDKKPVTSRKSDGLFLYTSYTIYYGLTSAILAVAVTLLISKFGFGMQ